MYICVCVLILVPKLLASDISNILNLNPNFLKYLSSSRKTLNTKKYF